jgi:hypothetical protein
VEEFEVLAALVVNTNSACYLRHSRFLLGFSSNLKMEAAYLSEKSVEFQWTTGHYIPGDEIFQLITFFG